ncbi:MAG: DegT/DnrJ/EryC1/StrS family aminotransferase [bacterium]|nr:DegT/DnrJ/EryC1/StrS family aminotransferase [bacterium]
MKVPQMSPWLGKEEYKAIESCFKENWLTEGPKTKQFNEKLLKLTKARFGVFAPNGTLALYLGLRALDIGPGDEVIVPDFTFYASATSVEMTGAKPVFVDVNRKNFQIDLKNADRLVNKKTKAIMPVHIYGTIADMKSVVRFAKRHKLKIIEDACQAVGVHRDGKHAGTFGEVGCFSFFADKTVSTVEGGYVITNDEKLYQKLLFLRNQGRIDRGSFIHPQIGYNFRITDIHSAIGLVQLRKLPEIKKIKNRILSIYKKQLAKLSEITFFEPDAGVEMIPFRVCILVDKAHELMSFMREKGIESRTFFYPLHRQPYFKYLQKGRKDQDDKYFQNAIYGYEHGICLPIFPTLTDRQILYVCDTIKDFYE